MKSTLSSVHDLIISTQDRAEWVTTATPLLASGGAFKPLVVSRGGLIEETTEEEMKTWSKELEKIGRG